MPIKQVLEARPGMCLLAEYPAEVRLVKFPIILQLKEFVNFLFLYFVNFLVFGFCCSYIKTFDVDLR